MGVSINGDTPHWMVYNWFFFIKMDDLEVFQETTIWTDTVKSYKIYPGKDDATKHRCWLCSCNNQQMYLVERLNQKFWVNTLLYMRRERESRRKLGGWPHIDEDVAIVVYISCVSTLLEVAHHLVVGCAWSMRKKTAVTEKKKWLATYLNQKKNQSPSHGQFLNQITSLYTWSYVYNVLLEDFPSQCSAALGPD